MSEAKFSHAPVMHEEVMHHLKVQPDGIYVDGTYGRGGHAKSILNQLGNNGRLIVMDRDPEAIAAARESIGEDSRVRIIHDDYANLYQILATVDLNQQVNGLLLDLGVSSPQLEDAARGFSFQENGPLDMRMNPMQGESAADWLQHARQEDISRVLWEFGEERHARRIAHKIIEARKTQNIDDTATLSGLISACVPPPRNKKHPATRSFQAIRIHINQELAQVSRLLESIFDILTIGGRLLVISFHSLEDRLIKRFFRLHSTPAKIPRGMPVRDDELQSTIRLGLIGKAIRAGAEELSVNPRARSAVLRVAERIS